MTTSERTGVRLRKGTSACPPERRLDYTEAKRQFGIDERSPNVCRVVATLALHEGPIPLTQRDLSERTGYAPPHIYLAPCDSYLG
jgi:hypothetical protein